MKIAVIGAESSIHIQRWMKALCERPDLEMHLITLHADDSWARPKNLTVHKLSNVPTIGYLFGVFELKRFLNQIKPDILHTHYATGYGTLGSLSQFRPHVLSVWGSDVYAFPYHSPIHKMMVSTYLKRADLICSTSQAMIEQVISVSSTPRERIALVPFGVDTRAFRPMEDVRAAHDNVVVGLVKNLEPTYGGDILIEAFASALEKLTAKDASWARRLKLVIGGDGSHKKSLEGLAQYLGLADVARFPGRTRHDLVPRLMNEIDIFVAPSRTESFGVAVIEASACGLPVIVSDVGGLPEVVRHEVTGLIIEKENIEALADAIVRLAESRDLRLKMGMAGRDFVQKHFEWSVCVDQMTKLYQSLVK